MVSIYIQFSSDYHYKIRYIFEYFTYIKRTAIDTKAYHIYIQHVNSK